MSLWLCVCGWRKMGEVEIREVLSSTSMNFLSFVWFISNHQISVTYIKTINIVGYYELVSFFNYLR